MVKYHFYQTNWRKNKKKNYIDERLTKAGKLHRLECAFFKTDKLCKKRTTAVETVSNVNNPTKKLKRYNNLH